MMMPLNTHLLNSTPRELIGRVTSLQGALQNVVASLAIALFATILQARTPIHVADGVAAAGGQATPSILANAAALAFGDVYRTALVMAAVAWCLAWTLRPGKSAGPRSGRGAADPTHVDSHVEREPVLAIS
jgi:hypothetical protein